MKHFLKYFLLLLPLGFMCSCEDELPEDTSGTKSGKDSVDVTYLLYMVGQNDLSSFLTDNINDLKTGYGKTDICANILVYADISETPELYLIRKDENGVVTKNTIKTYPDRYSVDPEVMKEVVNEVFAEYPARHRALTFSSHADGSLYTSQTVSKRSFGYEGAAGYGMNVTDIREALDDCPSVDLIMFDACMMANVETAYELKNNTHYLLATPNSVPGEGFPYDKVLPHLLKMTEEGFSQVAQTYMDYYQKNAEKWDDFAAVCLTDVTRLDSVAVYMDSLLQDAEVQERIPNVKRNQLQKVENGYALYDYGTWLESIGEGNRFLAHVKEHLERAVIYKAHGGYLSVDDWGYNLLIPVTDDTFCGLNTYVPPSNSYLQEVSQRTFFTTFQWYHDAGLWRSSYYNSFSE